MASKLSTTLFSWLIFLTCLLLALYATILTHHQPSPHPIHPPCNLTNGHWIQDPNRKPLYNHTCPFHRNSWNCYKSKRDRMETINSYKWVPENCVLDRIDSVGFLGLMRNRRIGFVGDSLNENFVVSLLCFLWTGDGGAAKWKKKGAWRGGYFPRFNVTVAYHRAVLLSKYEWQPIKHTNISEGGLKGTYKVDVDIPADDWVHVTKFYDILVFNTGHWWGLDKFPKETPLVFFRKGKPILPPLGILAGLQVVLDSMVSYIEREVPRGSLKFWRTQSPRHFYGGEWNQNGSCLFDEPLEEDQEQRSKQRSKRSQQSNHSGSTRHRYQVTRSDSFE